MAKLNAFFGGGGSLSPQVQENTDRISEISNPNLFINGGFDVDQRGGNSMVNIAKDGAYSGDRWWVNPSGSTTTKAVVAIKTNATHRDFNYLDVRWTDNEDNVGIGQRIEYPTKLSNKTLTLSFEVSSDNDFDVGVYIAYVGTSIHNTTIGRCTSRPSQWQKFTFTFELGQLTDLYNGLNDFLYVSVVDREKHTNTLLFRKMKLEYGDVATPFIADDPATNLAKCQRYFWSSGMLLGVINGINGLITNPNTYKASTGQIPFPVPMRVNPKMSWRGRNGEAASLAKVAIRRYHAETIYADTVRETQTVTTYGFTFLTTSINKSGFTSGDSIQYIPSLIANGSTGVIFSADAEL